MCMKRTNLVLDEEVLAEATRLGGQKTYSARSTLPSTTSSDDAARIRFSRSAEPEPGRAAFPTCACSAKGRANHPLER